MRGVQNNAEQWGCPKEGDDAAERVVSKKKTKRRQPYLTSFSSKTRVLPRKRCGCGCGCGCGGGEGGGRKREAEAARAREADLACPGACFTTTATATAPKKEAASYRPGRKVRRPQDGEKYSRDNAKNHGGIAAAENIHLPTCPSIPVSASFSPQRHSTIRLQDYSHAGHKHESPRHHASARRKHLPTPRGCPSPATTARPQRGSPHACSTPGTESAVSVCIITALQSIMEIGEHIHRAMNGEIVSTSSSAIREYRRHRSIQRSSNIKTKQSRGI